LLLAIKLVFAGATEALVYSAAGGGQAFTFYNVLLLAVFVGVAIAYGIGQALDYKPNKRLRQDNADLRRDCDDLQRRVDLLEAENEHLRKSRDFEAALAGALALIGQSREASSHEHGEILDAIHTLTAAIAAGGGGDTR
jgi:C4-dicarboxylate-specific signal transduction histidine kinase